MILGICDALWLRLLLMDLGYLLRQPIRLYCDNKATCDIAHNPVQHDRTKHVEVDKFFIKDCNAPKIPYNFYFYFYIFGYKLSQTWVFLKNC